MIEKAKNSAAVLAVLDLLNRISGKAQPLQQNHQTPNSQILQKAGSNEIKPTNGFGQKVKTPSPQFEVKEAEETLTQTQIPLKEPTKEKLALIQLKYQKPISKDSEVSKYLYKINDYGTLRKACEVTKYGGIGEETKKRTLLAGEIKQVKEEVRKRNNAEQENLQTDREYLQEEKSAELHNLKKISSQIWTLQTRINELSENKLSRLLHTARITKL